MISCQPVSQGELQHVCHITGLYFVFRPRTCILLLELTSVLNGVPSALFLAYKLLSLQWDFDGSMWFL